MAKVSKRTESTIRNELNGYKKEDIDNLIKIVHSHNTKRDGNVPVVYHIDGNISFYGDLDRNQYNLVRTTSNNPHSYDRVYFAMQEKMKKTLALRKINK